MRRLLSKEQRRFLKFCVVGASGVPVNLFFVWLGYNLLFAGLGDKLRTGLAFLLGLVVSIFTNFLLNDLWTWRDRQKATAGFLGRMLRFYLVSSAAAAIQYGTSMGLKLGLGLHYLVAPLIGIAVAMMVNFLVNNVWTFRERKPPPDSDAGGSPTR
jgi:dolichol-phosphate mannosyltransferase